MKNYQVLIKGYCVALVIATENEDKAMEIALDSVSGIDFEIEGAEIEKEVKDDELERARKHANVVAKPD